MAEKNRRHCRIAHAVSLAVALCAVNGIVASAASAQPPDRSAGANQVAIRSQFQRTTQFKVAILPSRTGAKLPDDHQIRLYASVDRGRTWSFVQAASSKSTAFSVNVQRDGDYLFAVRAAPKDEKDQVGFKHVPSYRAVVDTESPKIELTARRAPTGEIVAQWRATDLNLDQASLQLFAGFGEELKPIALDHRPGNDPKLVIGTTTWWPPGESGTLTVRASVTDLAGNPAVSSARVALGRAEVAEGSRMEIPETGRGDARDTGREYDRDANDQRDTPAREAGLDRSNEEPRGNDSVDGNAPSRGSRFDHLDGPPVIERFAPPAQPVPGESQPWQADASTNHSLERSVERGRNEAKPPAIHQPSNAPVEELPNASGVQPPVTKRVGPIEENHVAGAQARERRDARIAGAERPRVVSSRRVSLRYDVSSAGEQADPTSGLEVGLYSTRDGGETWTNQGIDPDNRSPFAATLDGEGLYGFRIVVRGRKQSAPPPPAAGELADMWVIVDETKPTVTIKSASVENNDRGRELLIRYEVVDAHLAARPIHLFYSDRPNGPWKTIGVGMANAGIHRWLIDSRLTGEVYLRLEAQDDAGHVGAFETAQAISLEAKAPAARIEGVESPGGGSARAAWPRYR